MFLKNLLIFCCCAGICILPLHLLHVWKPFCEPLSKRFLHLTLVWRPFCQPIIENFASISYSNFWSRKTTSFLKKSLFLCCYTENRNLNTWLINSSQLLTATFEVEKRHDFYNFFSQPYTATLKAKKRSTFSKKFPYSCIASFSSKSKPLFRNCCSTTYTGTFEGKNWTPILKNIKK